MFGAVSFAVLASCSFGMRGVDPEWNGTQEPECSDSYTPVVIDALTSSVMAGTAVEFALGETAPDVPTTEILVGGLAIAVIYAVSARTGANKYIACRLAKADWHARNAIRDASVVAAIRRHPSAVAGAASRPVPTAPARQVPVTETLGYFCIVRPQSGLNMCVRDRDACERARETFDIPDSETCAARKVAWCTSIDKQPRCFATQDICEAEVARAPGVSSACTEQR